MIPVSSAAITSSNSSGAVTIPVCSAAINAGPNISYPAGLVVKPKSKKKRQSSAIAVGPAETSHSKKARNS